MSVSSRAMPRMHEHEAEVHLRKWNPVTRPGTRFVLGRLRLGVQLWKRRR